MKDRGVDEIHRVLDGLEPVAFQGFLAFESPVTLIPHQDIPPGKQRGRFWSHIGKQQSRQFLDRIGRVTDIFPKLWVRFKRLLQSPASLIIEPPVVSAS